MWNPRWISRASDWTPESRVSTPESTRQVTVIALLFVVQGWIPRGVASQKNRSDTGDVPSFAPQHTFSARKEPENNGLGFSFSPVRSPDDPEKLSLLSHPVNRLDPDLDSGSDSGVHHGIHLKTHCAGDLPHAPLPSISNSYLGSRFLSLGKVSGGHFTSPFALLRRTSKLDHFLLRQVAIEPPFVEAQRDDRQPEQPVLVGR
jgi:hypothetical protein